MYSFVSVRRLSWLTIALGLGVALIVAGVVPAAAVGSGSWRVQKSPDAGGLSESHELEGVAATSPSNAWAVGYENNLVTFTPQTLVVHWNGKAWKAQKSLNPGGSSKNNVLYSVAATSATNAWAVGYYVKGTHRAQTLIEHWNGEAWKVQKSPNLGSSKDNDFLYGVAATSPNNAWAVGYYYNGTAERTLVEHWDGSAWKVQRSANSGAPRKFNFLYGVAATSATNAWAAGYDANSSTEQTLVEHWNGKAWKVQSSPNPGGSINNFDQLSGVAAASPANAWTVGYADNGTATRTIVEHWDGKAWKVQKSPNPGGSSDDNKLLGVAATSATNTWAVGWDSNRTTRTRTLIEHWDGMAWKVQQSPNIGNADVLDAVAATSATDAWAVGSYPKGTADQALIEHWH